MPLLINSLITQKTPQKMRGRPLLYIISFPLVLNPFFLFSSISPCIFPSLLEIFTFISFIPLLTYLLPFCISIFSPFYASSPTVPSLLQLSQFPSLLYTSPIAFIYYSLFYLLFFPTCLSPPCVLLNICLIFSHFHCRK